MSATSFHGKSKDSTYVQYVPYLLLKPLLLVPSQIEQLSGGPLLHALRRISDLPALPPGVLKTLEWQLRKDIAEVERVARNQSEQQIWLSNNR
jgi:hypothetical protein